MAEHELSRRDALAALAAVTGTATAGLALTVDAPQDEASGASDGEGTATDPFTAHERRTIRRVASTLYPSAVSNVDAFVTAYLDGLAAVDPDRASGMAEAVALLDDHATTWHDADLADLDATIRDGALRTYGLDDADPDPDGNEVQRVRHYLVDELLLALYASPTGGELVGLPNPPGHPGGLESYRRGPTEE